MAWLAVSFRFMLYVTPLFTKYYVCGCLCFMQLPIVIAVQYGKEVISRFTAFQIMNN